MHVSSEASSAQVDALSAVLSAPGGRHTLEQAIDTVRGLDEKDPIRRADRARKALDPSLVTVALSQYDLRLRGREKFGEAAEHMLFTPGGLEQASRSEVADHRAARFASAGVEEVLDLCCGIGADVLAFVRAGLAVRAIDLDPTTALVAAVNAPSGSIETGRAEDADWRSAGSVFLDPARRTQRGRTFDPDNFSPPYSFVREVLTTVRFAAAKLSPGLPHELIPDGVEAEWVSWHGGVKEAVLWSTGFASCTRRGTLLPEGVDLTDEHESSDTVSEIGRYLYEPDGAVIRAGLVQQVAALLPSGARIDEHLAYLTADRFVPTPFADAFEVLDVMPYSVKTLRAELRRRSVGTVEIKKRGVDVDPAALRRELKPSGPNALTVLLARIGKDRKAILARRPI